MPTCKGHESYGRIIPSVLELWYARDIVHDLIVTRHKYPLDPGNQEPPILLCLWRTSSTNAKSIPSLLMVILIISFPLPSQNSKKAKTIHHHGTHLTLLPSASFSQPATSQPHNTPYKIPSFHRNAGPNAAVTDNIQPWLMTRSVTMFLYFIFFFLEVNSHRDGLSCEL